MLLWVGMCCYGWACVAMGWACVAMGGSYFVFGGEYLYVDFLKDSKLSKPHIKLNHALNS